MTDQMNDAVCVDDGKGHILAWVEAGAEAIWTRSRSRGRYLSWAEVQERHPGIAEGCRRDARAVVDAITGLNVAQGGERP